MTKEERITYLQNLIDEEPGDPFAHYGLVLELAGTDADQGKERWGQMLERFPEYLPSYQLAGQVFMETGDTVTALETWRKGLELARKQNDRHAQKELMASLQNALIDD